MSILALLMSCRDAAVAPPDDTSHAGADSAGPAWITLPLGCTPGAEQAPPAVFLRGVDQNTQETPGAGWFVELVDVELDAERDILWGAGQGGLSAFDVSDPDAPALLGSYPGEGSNQGRYYRVELAGDRAYVTHRDRGLFVLDITDPADITLVGEVSGAGMEGMARAGDRLHVVGLQGSLRTFDVSAPDTPTLLSEVAGLSSAWDITVDGQYGYVSDSTEGVVVVALGDAPEVETAVDVGGGVQDIALAAGVLYAAAGAAGIVVLDRQDPARPEVVASLDYLSGIQSVAVDGAVLWAVNQLGVVALDISDPLAPVPLGFGETDEFAMHVTAGGGLAYVADWTRMEVWEADPSIAAPDISLSADTLYLREDDEAAALTVTNLGSDTLVLSEASIDDARFSLLASTDRVPPGETAALAVSFSGGADVEATLCLASNDPDASTVEVTLHTGGAGGHDAIGTPAPDFVLTDLDGNSWQLAEQLGHPVVLIYFATW